MGNRDGWTFLTNHGHVLVAIDQDPDIRLRDIATKVGITERAAQHIVSDLVAANFLSIEKIGRRNRYTIHRDSPMRHPVLGQTDVRQLLKLVGRSAAIACFSFSDLLSTATNTF